MAQKALKDAQYAYAEAKAAAEKLSKSFVLDSDLFSYFDEGNKFF